MQDGQLSNPIPNVNAELSITDYTQPIKLHFHHEKFWHIWLSPTEKNVTIMKTGKLINQITENEATIDYHEKLHSNEKQAIESSQSCAATDRLADLALHKRKRTESLGPHQSHFPESFFECAKQIRPCVRPFCSAGRSR